MPRNQKKILQAYFQNIHQRYLTTSRRWRPGLHGKDRSEARSPINPQSHAPDAVGQEPAAVVGVDSLAVGVAGLVVAVAVVVVVVVVEVGAANAAASLLETGLVGSARVMAMDWKAVQIAEEGATVAAVVLVGVEAVANVAPSSAVRIVWSSDAGAVRGRGRRPCGAQSRAAPLQTSRRALALPPGRQSSGTDWPARHACGAA